MTIHGTITISAKMQDLNDTSGNMAAVNISSNTEGYDKTLRTTNSSLVGTT
jgi:hypothetical protein